MFKYVIIVALGALSFGMLSSFAKIAYGQGYSAAEITFTQSAIGALILWLIVITRSIKNGSLKLTEGWKPLLSGCFMGMSAYTYYLSVAYIPASLAIVLLMQMTWMSITAEWIFFKKKPSGIELTSTLLLIAGSVFAGNLLNLEQINFSVTGIVLALISALIYSLYIVFTSKISSKLPMFEKSALMTTASALIILFINMKPIALSAHLDLGLLQWGAFLALFGTVIPPICFTTGMPKIGAGLSAVLLTLELPAAIFCAHLILNEKIVFSQFIGILIMLSAIIYLNLAKAIKLKRQKAFIASGIAE